MILNIVILIIFIIILLYVINNSFNKIVLEKFIPHNKPEILIIENCKKNFATDVNYVGNKEDFCYKYGFVTDPSLLAGICGNNKNPLYIIKDKESIYYGCIGTNDKKINWDLYDRNFTKYELTQYLSNNFPIKNINPSNLIMFITCDDNATVNANGKTYNHNGSNTFSTFVLPNINYNTLISCSFTNTGSGGGFCISYIWNGQLFIISINGFDSSINSIKINENINNQILTNNYNSYIPNMPVFMYKWYNLQVNVPQSISFNAGAISNVASFMNNMTVFLAINGTGVVKLNSSIAYNYNTPNKLINFDIQNVLLGDNLTIDCKGNNIKKDNPLLTIAYVYKGYIFVLNNKNIDTNDIIDSSNIISCTCTNWSNTYTNNSSVVTPPFITGWLSSSDQTSIFNFSTNIGTK
jgi:hypothetical protein